MRKHRAGSHPATDTTIDAISRDGTARNSHLTALLAQSVMGWRVAPARFLTGNRQWISRWRFQPLTNLEDAFRVLETAASNYTLRASSGGMFTAEVSVASRTGRATGKSKASIITVAVARAIGLDVPDGVLEVQKR